MPNEITIHIALDNDAWLNPDGSLNRFVVKEALNRATHIMTEKSSHIVSEESTGPIYDTNGNTSGRYHLSFQREAE